MGTSGDVLINLFQSHFNIQAYGVDTSHVRPGSLQGYLRGRPLFLRLGRQTIRAPILGVDARALANQKTPPADVPEYELLATLQRRRRSLVRYIER